MNSLKFKPLLFILLLCVCGTSSLDSKLSSKIENDIKIGQGEFKIRLTQLYQELKQNPLDSKSYNNLGDLYFKRGDEPTAQLMFEFALKIDSNYVSPLFNLSIIKTKEGKLDSAQLLLEKICALKSDHIMALANLSRLLYQQQRFDEALEKGILAYNLDPENSQLAYNMGVIYQALGDNGLSLEFYQKALNLNPANLQAQERLNILLHQTNPN